MTAARIQWSKRQLHQASNLKLYRKGILVRKKAKLLPADMDDGIFTQAEITVLCTLMEIYSQALSADGSISTTVLRRCNRQGLFELGVRSKEAVISSWSIIFENDCTQMNSRNNRRFRRQKC